MADLQVPVLIIGGGGAGLTASMLLSQLGIKSLLVNARPTTSDLPKAHVLNQRAMEILNDAGVADAIYKVGTPPENMKASAWYAGFAGGSAAAGRKIGQLEAWGAGYTDPNWIAASPFPSTNLPQIRLEPILRARAEELAPDMVRFNHEVTAIQQDADGVTAEIRDLTSGDEYTVRAAYVLACDGGRTVGPALGIEMEGPRDLAQEISIHMTADLSRWATDPDVLIRWIWVPEIAAMSVLVPMGPEKWGPESEEWVFHLNYPVDDPRAMDDAAIEQDMRTALGIGDHPLEVHKVTRWSLEGVVAQRLQIDRVFLLGDAAHRHPPTGGLGLNSAIQDAHNICWKVAQVLQGNAASSLLTSYEPERKPVVQNNVDCSVESALNHFVIGAALGIDDQASGAENWAALERLWDDKPEHDVLRRDVFKAIATQTMEFGEHNIEYGYEYVAEGSAVVPDLNVQTESPDPRRIYRASTAPGHCLPHAWLESPDGQRRSTLDLVQPGQFLLITTDTGQAWRDAGGQVAQSLGIELSCISIGLSDGDYLDLRGSWLNQREIDPEGAILVRPDRFVAWRSLGAVQSPSTELERALGSILGRSELRSAA